MMDKEQLEIEEVYKYIKSNPDVWVAEVSKHTMLSKIIVSKAIAFLEGAGRVGLHRVVGRNKLYKVNKVIQHGND